MAEPRFRVVVIGDSGVGKTSMLVTYWSGKFPTVYIPTSFETVAFYRMVDGQAMIMDICDTAGGEDYPRLRPLCYPGTHVFLLCFDIGNRESYDCIPGEWIPEVRNVCPHAPIMLIGCKKDLRDSTPDTCVPFAEAEKKAEEWKLANYFEISSLSNDGLDTAFKQCMRIGYHQFMMEQKNMRPLNRLRKRFKCHRRHPPLMPLEEPLPVIESGPSGFAEDWLAAFKAQEHTDVIFVLGSGTEIGAHQIVLCAASPFFANIINTTNRSEMFSHAQSVGISNIEEGPEHNGHASLTIVLERDIAEHILKSCLEFLYSGLPGAGLDEEPESIEKLIYLSHLWELHLLESICINIQNEEPNLNPSIAVSHNTEMGERLVEDFLLTKKWTDVSFDVEGRHISAHRLVLCTRCPVFATMLSERFREGAVADSGICIPNTTFDAFKNLLRYLYSDHTPIEGGDPVGILVLANQFCQSRLVTLAEYYITKLIENSFKRKRVDREDIDVVDILYSAKDHNAKQLPEWCLRFIAKNYTKFKSRPEFQELAEEHRSFVEEHQWPPLSYIRELEQYRAAKRKCIVM